MQIRTDSYIVEADREKLKRVVTNIVQNSMKYMDKKHKEIQVCLSSSSDEVIVEMKDNGSGIGKEDIPHIFDSFYRTDIVKKLFYWRKWAWIIHCKENY